MDFTEIYKQTSNLVQPSPGNEYVLTAVQDRLILRRTATFEITRTWLVDSSPSSSTSSVLSRSANAPSSSAAWITHIGWSCDGLYMLACCAKRGVVGVFAVADERWSARIESGVEGLVKAEWAPDGRSVLCFSEWGVSVACLCSTL